MLVFPFSFRAKNMKIYVLALTILLIAQSIVKAQPQKTEWRVNSSPDKSFNVELPSPLRKVMSFEGEHGANLEPDQKIMWADCYAAIETTPEESRFGIIVINGRSKFLRSQKREKILEVFSWMFLADDDELQFMRAPVAVMRNRLTGKEYFYVKETDTSYLYIRGRIFDTASRIYVLVFVGRDANDLRSADAERFLNSFRLAARSRVRKD